MFSGKPLNIIFAKLVTENSVRKVFYNLFKKSHKILYFTLIKFHLRFSVKDVITFKPKALCQMSLTNN